VYIEKKNVEMTDDDTLKNAIKALYVDVGKLTPLHTFNLLTSVYPLVTRDEVELAIRQVDIESNESQSRAGTHQCHDRREE
jgi:hypothetical protein